MVFPLYFSTGFVLLCCARDPCVHVSELHTRSWFCSAVYTQREPKGLCLCMANSSRGQSWMQLHQEGSQLKETLKHTPELRGDSQTHQAQLSLQDEILGSKTWRYFSLVPGVLHNLALKIVRILLFKGRWGTWNSFSMILRIFSPSFLY